VSDDEKPVSVTTETIAPTKESTTSPAIHDDRMWEGPRVIDAFPGSPLVESKSEYARLMRENDYVMRDQQESGWGDAPPKPIEVPLSLQPTPPPPRLTQDEAHCMAAMIPIFKRYGIRHWSRCQQCFTRKREDRVRVIIREQFVAISCQCGSVEYRAPAGTTDMTISRLANQPVREKERTIADIVIGGVHEQRPAYILNATEAYIIRGYMRFQAARTHEPVWHCSGCWNNFLDANEGMGMSVTADEITIVCHCRMLFERTRKPSDPTTH
jgi:hypothetical protein